MDRISCISYVLFQNDDQALKDAAIDLIKGDLTLKEAKQNKQLRKFILEAERFYRRNRVNTRNVAQFSSEYVYS